MSRGEGPDEMIDPNTKTDYNKMKRLLQLDKLDGDRKGVIRTIAEDGEIVSSQKSVRRMSKKSRDCSLNKQENFRNDET